MGFNSNEFFNNLETGTSQEENSQEVEQEELEETAQTSEEDNSEGEEGTPEAGDSKSEEARKFAGRYESVEQLEKGYKNLQAKFTQVIQSMQKKKSEETPQASPVPQSQGIPLELATHPQFVELLKTNPMQAGMVVAEYNAHVAQNRAPGYSAPVQSSQNSDTAAIRTKLEVLEMKTKYPDFEEVAVDIPAVLDGNPWLWSAPAPIETAYKLVKHAKMEEALSTAEEAGKQTASRKRSEKKGASMERQSAKGQNEEKTPEEEIADSILGGGGKQNAFIL